MFDRSSAAKEAATLTQSAAKVEERLNRFRSDLTAARGKATADQVALLEDVVTLEQLRMLELLGLAREYETVAAGGRAFGPMPNAPLPSAKGAA